MPTTINIDINSRLNKLNQLTCNEKRQIQYLEGIQQIYKLNKNYDIKIYLSDNSDFFDNNSEIKDYINTTHIEIISNVSNIYGKVNKGAGLIENWVYNKDLLKKYDWIIHFEPRQLLQSNQFINNFLQNPRNLFTLGKEKNHFNTGLFCINSESLLEFININNPDKLIKNNISIEYVLYSYFIINKIKNKIEFSILDKMDLLWYDTYSKTTYKM